MAVAAGHARAMLFENYSSVPEPSLSWRVFYGVTGMGHEATMMFFVLSGFLVSSSVEKAWRNGEGSWLHYAVARLSRLWTVAIPAIVLGVLIDFAGSQFASGKNIYFESLSTLGAFGDHVVADSLTGWNIAGALLFLQGLVTKIPGSNVPLWTLSAEFWFYVAFPAFFSLTRSQRSPIWVGAWILATIFLLLTGLASGFFIWSLGWAAWFCRRSNPTLTENRWVKLVGTGLGVLLVPACLLSKRLPIGPLSVDCALGLLFSIFLYAAPAGFGSENGAGRFWSSTGRIASSVAAYSYSLYAIHFPFLLLLRATWLTGERRLPSPKALFEFLAVVLALNAVAYVFYLLFERRTERVRDRMLRMTATFFGAFQPVLNVGRASAGENN